MLKLKLIIIILIFLPSPKVISNDSFSINNGNQQNISATTNNGAMFDDNNGTVNVFQNQDSKLDIPKFMKKTDSQKNAEELNDFLEKNKGKLVQINTDITVEFGKMYDELPNEISLSTEPCNTIDDFVVNCKASSVIVDGNADNYTLDTYKSDYRLSGYFIIDDNVIMAQGINYTLKPVSREKVLFETQKK